MAAPPAQHSSPNRSTYRVVAVCGQPATNYFRRVRIFVIYLLVISFTHTHTHTPTDLFTGNYYYKYRAHSGPGSSVGIATDYGLDGPGSNPGGGQDFPSVQPALWPTQPTVQWVPGLSRG